MRYLLLLLPVSLFCSLSGGNRSPVNAVGLFFRFCPPGFPSVSSLRPPVEQISPDKDVNFSAPADPPEADTIQPQHLLPAQRNTGTGSSAEPWALLCCANLPADSALLCCFCSSAHSFAVGFGLKAPTVGSRRSLTIPPLP